MPTRISIAGLGVVGSGLLSLLAADRRLSRQGIDIAIAGVSARNRTRKRPMPIEQFAFFDNPVELATHPDTDIFVELIGGADGPAKAAVEAALAAGKPVVTANKALIAEHGPALAALAEQKGTSLRFEAAVAGGTPVVSGIRSGVAACTVTRVEGILNGTCNYILSTMAETGAPFDGVLLEAQKAGFAEADPTFDVDGIDAAHKLAILATLAFDAKIPMADIKTTGIRKVQDGDIAAAKELGLAIKLLAQAIRSEGRITLRVGAAMIPAGHSFAAARGAQNAVVVEAEPLGVLTFSGPGAGAGATASAVAADICDIIRGQTGPVYATPASALATADIFDAGEIEDPYFVRLTLKNAPGAMANVTQALAKSGISIERLVQPPAEGDQASVVVVTHPCSARAIDAAARNISGETFAVTAPSLYPIITP